MSANFTKAISVMFFSGLGVYMGVKFFEPMVIEQLRKDGNLRSDIPIPEFDENGDKIIAGINKKEVWSDFQKQLEANAQEKKPIGEVIESVKKKAAISAENNEKKDT
ncbi:unnamed protein product [Ambrosiozyma monospora]|uniref:Unnamed protein product n=1 Tax=Ambrosiozyma monospora TaxID=43982 RepID=A0ACB5T7N9_AMBMO|nr:unnamed protein product [Ambrosiozyma monospora]